MQLIVNLQDPESVQAALALLQGGAVGGQGPQAPAAPAAPAPAPAAPSGAAPAAPPGAAPAVPAAPPGAAVAPPQELIAKLQLYSKKYTPQGAKAKLAEFGGAAKLSDIPADHWPLLEQHLDAGLAAA